MINKGELKLTIPTPNILPMKLSITGTSPIIFNKWSQKAIKQIEEKQQKKAAANQKKEARDPKSEYLGSFYRDSQDNIALPALNIKQAIVGAARNVQGATMTLLRGAVFIVGDENGLIPLLVNGKPIKVSEKVDFTGLPDNEIGVMGIDSQTSDIQMRRDIVRLNGFGSPADLRYRGQVTNWTMELLVKFNADVISAEQVINLLQIAGFSCGLGEWRPEKNGDHGTFDVTRTLASIDQKVISKKEIVTNGHGKFASL